MSDVTDTTTSKPWWSSKTIWVNVIAGIASVTTAFGLNLNLDVASQTAIVGGAIAIANIILRAVSKTAVTIS